MQPISRQDGCLIVQVLETNLGMKFLRGLRGSIDGHLREGGPLILDLAGVEAVDGGGIGALLGLLRMCEPKGGLLLASSNGVVRRVLEQAGLDDLFPIFPAVDEALAYAMPLLRLDRAIREPVEEEELTCLPSSSIRTSHPVLCP
jgi:anti-anti-sigma factor